MYQRSLLYCFQGLHSASVPGILSLDLCPSDTNKVLTGTLNQSFILYFICWDARQRI